MHRQKEKTMDDNQQLLGLRTALPSWFRAFESAQAPMHVQKRPFAFSSRRHCLCKNPRRPISKESNDVSTNIHGWLVGGRAGERGAERRRPIARHNTGICRSAVFR